MSTPSRGEVLLRLGAVGQQQVGEPVGQDAVDLLGHVQSPERSPASRCATGMPQLGGGERAGERRVHVAGDDDERRALLEQDPLERDQHLAGLLAVAARADAERVVGRREAEVLEDLLRHPAVVVLARVDDDLAGRAAPLAARRSAAPSSRSSVARRRRARRRVVGAAGGCGRGRASRGARSLVAGADARGVGRCLTNGARRFLPRLRGPGGVGHPSRPCGERPRDGGAGR